METTTENAQVETWEAKQAREKNQKEAARLQFVQKMTEVADILGFVVDSERYRDNWAPMLAMIKGNETIIASSNHYRHIGRMEFSVRYPRDANGQTNDYQQFRGGITVDEKKTSEQIAKDIERRLLPEYRKSLAIVLERNKASDDYEAGKRFQIKIVADYFGDEMKDRNNTDKYVVWPHHAGPGWDAPMQNIEAQSDDKVKFNLELSANIAVQVFDLLKSLGLITERITKED